MGELEWEDRAAWWQWPLHALLPRKNGHFTFQLEGIPGSISATRGKWAQPRPGPLQLLLMNLLSELPTFLYAN